MQTYLEHGITTIMCFLWKYIAYILKSVKKHIVIPEMTRNIKFGFKCEDELHQWSKSQKQNVVLS